MAVMRPKQLPSWLDDSQARAVLRTISFPGFEDDQVSETATLPNPDLGTLSLLHIHFLLTFPFEALSLNYEPSGTMSSSLSDIYSRFVTRRHGGGYCLQVNLLYRELLSFLGFRYVGVLGRVFSPMTEDWSGYTHTATLVYLASHLAEDEGKSVYYLSDVGFGSSPHRPILLRHGWEELGRGTDRFRVIKTTQPNSTLEPDPTPLAADEQVVALAESQISWTLENHKHGNWQPCYTFHLFQCSLADYHASNRASSHAESVPFATTILVVRYLLGANYSPELSADLVEKDGLNKDLHPYHPSFLEQRMIVGDKFIVKVGDQQTVSRVIESEKERVELLKREFGLLGHVETEDALKTIQNKPSRLPKLNQE